MDRVECVTPCGAGTLCVSVLACGAAPVAFVSGTTSGLSDLVSVLPCDLEGLGGVVSGFAASVFSAGDRAGIEVREGGVSVTGAFASTTVFPNRAGGIRGAGGTLRRGGMLGRRGAAREGDGGPDGRGALVLGN